MFTVEIKRRISKLERELQVLKDRSNIPFWELRSYNMRICAIQIEINRLNKELKNNSVTG